MYMKSLEPELFPIPLHDGPENQDPSSTRPPSLMRHLASAISSLKRRFKLVSNDITSAIGEESVKKYLELAISSMKNLETVRWTVQFYDPSWTEIAVIRGLARLPQLQDLQLLLYRDRPFSERLDDGYKFIQLNLLSGLKKFSLSGRRDIVSGLAGLIAKCPQLVHLEIKLSHYGVSWETTSTLHDLLSKVPEDHPLQLTHLALDKMGICIDSFTIPHLRSLTSLDLRNTSETLEWAYSTSTSDTFAILKKEGILLKHVVVSDVGIFDYLCSYSGLETLDLCSMTFESVEESNTFARTFYKCVLPQLVHSLQVLKIQPEYEGRWCFNPEDDFQSVALFQCNKLRSLSVALNSTSFLRSINFHSRDCALHQFKDNLDDEISSLINLSLSLPALSEFCIVVPKFAFESGVVIQGVANMVMVYHKTVIGLVTRSITELSINVGHNTTSQHLLPDFWVDGKKLYQYQTLTTLEDEERWRYVLTYDKLLNLNEYVEDFIPRIHYIRQGT